MRRLLSLAAALACLWGCDLSPNREVVIDNRLSVVVPDSLMHYDVVRVILFKAGTQETLMVAWNGSLDFPSQLLDLRPTGYRGQALDILVEAERGGVTGFRRLSVFRADGSGHDLKALAPEKDTVKPIILNPDTSVVFLAGDDFTDHGYVPCTDNFDRFVGASVEGFVNSEVPGDYRYDYLCVDKAGNQARSTRRFKVQPRPAFLPALADASADTATLARSNAGLAAAIPLDGRTVGLLRFDLTRTIPGKIKSAKLRLNTFGIGPWNGSPALLLFRFKQPSATWLEGNGNPWFFDGAPRSGGAVVLANYSLPPQVLADSRAPGQAEGVSGQDTAVTRASPIDWLRQETGYSLAQSVPVWPGKIPLPEDLVVLELDVTPYVRKFKKGDDPDLLLAVEELPEGLGLGILTKDIGDGTLGPTLLLEY